MPNYEAIRAALQRSKPHIRSPELKHLGFRKYRLWIAQDDSPAARVTVDLTIHDECPHCYGIIRQLEGAGLIRCLDITDWGETPSWK